MPPVTGNDNAENPQAATEPSVYHAYRVRNGFGPHSENKQLYTAGQRFFSVKPNLHKGVCADKLEYLGTVPAEKVKQAEAARLAKLNPQATPVKPPPAKPFEGVRDEDINGPDLDYDPDADPQGDGVQAPKDEAAAEAGADDGLETLSVAELKELAESEGIHLAGARAKEPIISKIREARAA